MLHLPSQDVVVVVVVEAVVAVLVVVEVAVVAVVVVVRAVVDDISARQSSEQIPQSCSFSLNSMLSLSTSVGHHGTSASAIVQAEYLLPR